MKKYLLGERAARFLTDAMNATGGSTSAGTSAKSIHSLEFADAFTVRWSQSQASGSGAWVIYLPERCLVVNGSVATVGTGMSQPTGYPSRWYLLSGIDSDEDAVYLNVLQDGSVTFTDDPSATSVKSVLVAEIDLDDTTKIVTVRQHVRGTLTIQSGQCFDLVRIGNATKFANRHYRVGGKTYTLASDASVPSSGIVALVIPATGTSPVASIATYSDMSALVAAEANPSNYIVPLYQMAGGVPIVDFRNAPSASMGEF